MSSPFQTSTRGQPPVVQLLPFSENDAALSGPSCSLAAQKHERSSSEKMIELPVLAVSTSDTVTKSCSNIAFSSNNEDLSNTSSFENHIQKLPVLTSHTDKRIRRHSENTDSQHGLSLEVESLPSNARVSHTFSFFRNEMNFPTKDRSLGDSHSTTSAEARVDDYNSYKNMVKPLPKPSFKPTECQWFHGNKKYSQNSVITDAKEEMEKQKRNLYHTSTRLRQAGRIKFNVKELPRSKTPIAEHDPDKLNMKQVIEFLQTSNKFKLEEYDEATSKKSVLKPKIHLSKRLSLRSAGNKTGMKAVFFDQKQQLIKLSHSCDKLSGTSTRDKMVATESQQVDQRPKSLDKNKHESQNGYIPPIICKIQNKMDKSFRLHRFVTLAQDVVGSLPNVADKSSHDHTADVQDTHFQNAGISDNSKEVVVTSVSSSEKSERSSKTYERRHSETAQSISSTGMTNNKLLTRPEKRSNLKFTHISNDGTERIQNMNKVICLPSANVETDSDDETFILSAPRNADKKFNTTDYDINKVENTAFSNQVNRLNSETDDKVISYSRQEPIIGVSIEGASIHVPNTPGTHNKYADKQIEISHSHLDQFSIDITADSLPIGTRQSFTSTTVTKEEQTRKETVLHPYQLNTHQQTFIRLLNQELATLKRTTTWLDHQNNVFSPLIYKHKLLDGTKNTSDAREMVKLSLRRERNKTRVSTYMTDMEEGNTEQ